MVYLRESNTQTTFVDLRIEGLDNFERPGLRKMGP